MADGTRPDYVLYLRKSKGRAGISRQRTITAAHISRIGGTIAGEFIDGDRTAYRKPGATAQPEREEFGKMLAFLSGHPGTGIAAYHADRISRDTEVTEDLIRTCMAGRHLVETPSGGSYDLSTATGRKRLRQDAVDAAYEVDHMSERRQAEKWEVAQNGEWRGGRRPFGYGKDGVTLRGAEAQLLADATRAVISGQSLGAIARQWNADGVLTTTGGLWQARQLARTAVIVGIAYVLSNLTGLGQRIIVTSRFGTSVEYDAFNAAFRIPDLLFSLLAGGALASAFIPTFTARLSNNQQRSAWRLAIAVAGLVFAFLSIVAVIAALFAPTIIRTLIAPGFDDAQVDLTAALMRMMLISTVIFGVSGLLMGVLQSNNAFLAPALAPSVYNLGIMFGALVLGGQGIYGVATGVVLGAVLHLIVQVPALLRILRVQKLTADAGASAGATESRPQLIADIRNVMRLMGPRILGLGAVQVNLIVTVSLASSMGAGAVSALNIAFATLILPQAAIAQAIATVLFPTISAHAARGERAQFANALSRAINVVSA